MARIFEKHYRPLTEAVADKYGRNTSQQNEWTEDKSRQFQGHIIRRKVRLLAITFGIAIALYFAMLWLASHGFGLILGVVILPAVIVSLVFACRELTELGNDIDRLIYRRASHPSVWHALRSSRLIMPTVVMPIVLLLSPILSSANFSPIVTFLFLMTALVLWAARAGHVAASRVWLRNGKVDCFTVWPSCLVLVVLAAIIAW